MVAGRVVYAQPTYYDSGGSIISTGATMVLTDRLGAPAGNSGGSRGKGKVTVKGKTVFH